MKSKKSSQSHRARASRHRNMHISFVKDHHSIIPRPQAPTRTSSTLTSPTSYPTYSISYFPFSLSPRANSAPTPSAYTSAADVAPTLTANLTRRLHPPRFFSRLDDFQEPSLLLVFWL